MTTYSIASEITGYVGDPNPPENLTEVIEAGHINREWFLKRCAVEVDAGQLSRDIARAVAAEPDLCGAGYRDPDSWIRGLNFELYRGEMEDPDTAFPVWVALALAFLDAHAEPCPVDDTDVEVHDLCEMVKESVGCYVDIGALIVAAIIRGYPIRRSTGSGCWVGMRWSEAGLLPVLVRVTRAASVEKVSA